MEFIDVHGAHVPALGLGTWQITGATCRRVVEQALAMGYRRVDTAQAYGNEVDIAGALRDSGIARDELWITTKLGIENLRYDDALRSARESLKRLALDKLDLLLIHWPSDEVPLAETLSALERLQEEGLTRHVGVSNFPPAMLDEARKTLPILSIQVEYHPYLSQAQLVRYAQEFKLMLTAYSPLARGRTLRDARLQAIGERHGKSASQVALRWLVQQRNVSAIPKASSEEHLRSNLDIFDFVLSLEEMQHIHELERGERLIDPVYAPDWHQL